MDRPYSCASPPGALSAEGRHHHRLDRVQAVLGLVEDDRGRRLEDLVGHLHGLESELLVDGLADLGLPVVEGRQAVQEFDVGIAGFFQGGPVYLVGLEQSDALRPDGIGLAHRHPHIGVEKIAAGDPLGYGIGNRDSGAGGFGDVTCSFDQFGAGMKLLRGDDAEIHSHFGGAHQQRVGHVVAPVAQKGECHLLQRLAAVLLHGQDVRQRLGGMELVGEAVPDRHAGVLRQFLHPRLLKAAVLDAVVHAAQHAGGVANRLFLAELRAGRIKVGHLGTLVVRGDLKRTARAGRSLLEDQGDVLALQVLRLGAGFLGLFQFGREIQ